MARKYFIDDLPESWDAALFEMAEQGCGREEVLAKWKISYSVHARFLVENSEYKDAWEYADMLRKAYYLRVGRENLGSDSKKFNLGLYAFTMKNIYSWRDTPLVPEKGNTTLPDKLKEIEVSEKYKTKHKESEVTVQ